MSAFPLMRLKLLMEPKPGIGSRPSGELRTDAIGASAAMFG